jgi:hypothetical protein
VVRGRREGSMFRQYHFWMGRRRRTDLAGDSLGPLTHLRMENLLLLAKDEEEAKKKESKLYTCW